MSTEAQAPSGDPVVPAAPEAVINPTVTPAPVKFAGKFDNPDALEKGYRELNKTLGITVPDSAKLFGKDGMYTSVEKLAESYKAKESLIGRLAKPAEPTAPTNPKAPADPLSITPAFSDDDGIPEIVTKAGLKIDELSTQYAKDGKLTTEQYAALKKAGYPPKVADAMAEGMAAKSILQNNAMSQVRSQAEQFVGGKAQLDALVEWAKTSPEITPEDRADIDARLKNGKTALAAVKQLAYMHREAADAGNANALVTGSAPASQMNIQKPRNMTEWKTVRAAADKGDKNALARMGSMSPADMSKLYNS